MRDAVTVEPPFWRTGWFMGDQPAPRIEIGARPRDGEVLCFVRDNGAATIPPD